MVNTMDRHPNLLDNQQSLLVIIDVQTKLLTAMPELQAALMVANLNKLAHAVQLLKVPVLLTEQYPQGLGQTVPQLNLPADLQSFSKTGFSCLAAEGFRQALLATGRSQIILCGQETHVCVLQTALALLQENFQVFVVTDAVCSRQSEHKELALQRMQQQGASLVCVESILFEWLADAKHMHFKAISALIR